MFHFFGNFCDISMHADFFDFPKYISYSTIRKNEAWVDVLIIQSVMPMLFSKSNVKFHYDLETKICWYGLPESFCQSLGSFQPRRANGNTNYMMSRLTKFLQLPDSCK